MEVIGERPFRAKAKRRKAPPPGKSATDDEAQFPQVVEAEPCSATGVLATEWARSSVAFTHGDLPGSAMSGSP